MSLEIHRLDASLEGDFEQLHAAARGGPGCHCVAWWVPTWEGWGTRSEGENRDLRRKLFERGEHDGYLAFDGERPVGWCQVGPRDRLPKLREQFDLERDASTWAVTCFLVRPDARRSGVARALLVRVLEGLRAAGVERVEAFPRRGGCEEDLWNGPEELYLQHGFRVVRQDVLRPVLALDLVSWA